MRSLSASLSAVAVAALCCTLPCPAAAGDDSGSCSADAGESGTCATPPTSRLASLSCSGTLEVFPDLPFGMVADVSKYRKLANAAFDQLESRLSCHCPDLTREQFLNRFSPVRVVLNLLSGKPAFEEDIPCLDEGETFTRDIHKYLQGLLSGSSITLPETCTRDAFIGADGCRVEMNTRGNLTATLKVAVAECADGPIPSLGVWCSGEACATLFQPCAADGCGDAQECVIGMAGVEGLLGDLLPPVPSVLQDYFGVNTSSLFDHLVRLVDGDIDSDRSIDDCEAPFAEFATTVVSRVSEALGLSASNSGICLPKQWQGFRGLSQSFYDMWEKMSAMPRKDECAPLKNREDSEYGWRRGQNTAHGVSGGGWCIGYDDCNFHRQAGDCESDDDFEYFMGKLYCKYKKEDACRSYGPYCVWNPAEKTKYKCIFNQTTQLDGIVEGSDWLRGIKCSNMKKMASHCAAATEPIKVCEREFCACSGGSWDMEEGQCTMLPEDQLKKKKCPDMVQCWGAMQQCYEKSSEESAYNRNARGCEEFFMCRCTETAASFGCDAKKFCGRRCACLYSESDRFVGSHCDLRLIRGEVPTIFSYEEDGDAPVPVLPWDGSLRKETNAAAFLRSQKVPQSLAAPAENPITGSEPLLVLGCDGRLWVAPKSDLGFALHLRGLDGVAEGAVKAALSSFRCAIEGVSDDDVEALQQMAEAYFMHTPQLWVSRFLDGYPKDAFFKLGTLADYIFNITGESESHVYAPAYLAGSAEGELYNQHPGVSQGGWFPHVKDWVREGMYSGYHTVRGVMRHLGLLPHDKWYEPLHELFANQNEQERNEGIKAVIFGRQQELSERQQSKAFPSFKWEGKVKVPENYFTHTNGRNDKLGLSMQLRRGNVDLYFAQCPTSGLAEFQIGASGALSDAIHLRKSCKKDTDCGPEAESQCKELEGTMYGVDMYHLDFVSGFLWGGNFTKGRMTGCSVLSTTINQLDFSTVKNKCRGVRLWKNNLGSLFQKATGNPVKPGKKPTFCHIRGDDIVAEVTEGVEEGDMDLSTAQTLTTRPFELP